MGENKLLHTLKNDIDWMKDKQKKHDIVLDKIWDKLDKGSGKIADNRGRTEVNKARINGLIKGILVGTAVLSSILGWMVSKIL